MSICGWKYPLPVQFDGKQGKKVSEKNKYSDTSYTTWIFPPLMHSIIKTSNRLQFFYH